jgi:hypothetical protein
MQCEKLYNLQSKANLNCANFAFKTKQILCDYFSKRRKLGAYIQLDFNVTCRAFHAASSGIFCFF